MSELNSSLPAWGAVAAHAKELIKAKLRDLSASDPKRWQNFHVEHDGWLLDISRQRITHQTLALLFDLARAVDVSGRIAAMFRGDPINTTEQRAVLHTALRSDFAGGPAIQAEVKASRQALAAYVSAVRSGKKVGATGKKFKHVVNVGIGGSDLGPLLVCDALRHEWSGGLTPHFVSNVDRTQLEDLTRTIDPAETLVIICSKTFVTQETQSNANAAREWIVGALGEKSPANHFVAVSTNGPAMDKFGIAPDHRFTMWDWVGGRYSVWSAIGLTIAEIVIGTEALRAIPAGRQRYRSGISRRRHSEKNLPVLLGLIGVWNRTFLNLPTLAGAALTISVLGAAPAYLQQLEMESNGKSVSLQGIHVGFRHAHAYRLGRARVERAAFLFPNAAPGYFDPGAGFHPHPCAALRGAAPKVKTWHCRIALRSVRRRLPMDTRSWMSRQRCARLGRGAEVTRIGPHLPARGQSAEFAAAVSAGSHLRGRWGSCWRCMSTACSCKAVSGEVNSFDQFGVELGKFARRHRHDRSQGAAGQRRGGIGGTHRL